MKKVIIYPKFIESSVVCNDRNFHDFDVQKISYEQALTANQYVIHTPNLSFEEALKKAGLVYSKRRQLREREKYEGFVALHFKYHWGSAIVIYLLRGSLRCDDCNKGDFLLHGKIYSTNNIAGQLDDLVKSGELPKEVRKDIMKQFLNLKLGPFGAEVYVKREWAKLLIKKTDFVKIENVFDIDD